MTIVDAAAWETKGQLMSINQRHMPNRMVLWVPDLQHVEQGSESHHSVSRVCMTKNLICGD